MQFSWLEAFSLSFKITDVLSVALIPVEATEKLEVTCNFWFFTFFPAYELFFFFFSLSAFLIQKIFSIDTHFNLQPFWRRQYLLAAFPGLQRKRLSEAG